MEKEACSAAGVVCSVASMFVQNRGAAGQQQQQQQLADGAEETPSTGECG
jgi:hypothetical protein